MERQKIFLFLSIAAILAVCFMMISQFLGYILTGLILAFLLQPLKKRLDKYMAPEYSSTLVIMITILGAILPLIFILGFVAGDAANLVNSLNQTENIGISGIEQRIESITGTNISLEERIRSTLESIGGAVLSSTSKIVSRTSSITIGLSLMLFVEFYGLKDGRRAINWTEKFDLMPTAIQKDLYRDTARTTKAVVKGHIFVAIATGLLTGLGLIATGIPNSIFWSFVAIISGLIPVIGVALVWVPAAVYLLLNGSTVLAASLTLYGLLAIGGAENFLRPYLVDEEADLHPLYILLGVIGGIGLFGVIGIFVGPVVFGIAKSLLNIYRKNLEEFS
jgi:predicted PurR-regulated permease PerM